MLPPPASPAVLLDVASRMRVASSSSSMSLALETNACVVPDVSLPTTAPRSRDFTWDRSRNTTFNNLNRPTVRDQTWSQSNGIVFAPSKPPSRSYPAKPLTGSRSSINKSTSSNPSPNQRPPPAQAHVSKPTPSHRPSNQRPSNAPSPPNEDLSQHTATGNEVITGLTKDNQDLTNTVNNQKEVISGKKAEIVKLKASLETTQTTIEEQESTITKLQDVKTIMEKDKKKLKEEKQKLDDIKIANERSLKEAKLAKVQYEQAARRERFELQVRYEEELVKDPQHTKVMENMCKINEELDRQLQQREEERERKHKLESGRLRKLRKELMAKRELLDKEIAQAEKERTAAEENERVTNQLRQKLEVRRKENRKDYGTYRELFFEHSASLKGMLIMLHRHEASLEQEAKTLGEMRARFGKWKTILDQPGNYKPIGDTIMEFYDRKISHIDKMLQEMQRLSDDLSAEWDRSKLDGHESRELTRFLHLQAHDQTPFQIARLAYSLNRFSKPHRAAEIAISRVEKMLLRTQSRATRLPLQNELALLKRESNVLNKLRGLSQTIGQISSLQMLLDEPLAEKLAYFETKAVKDNLDEMLTSLNLNRDSIRRSPRGGPLNHQISEQEREYRAVMQAHQVFIRKRKMLQLMTGEIKPKQEEATVDRKIKAQIRAMAANAFRSERTIKVAKSGQDLTGSQSLRVPKGSLPVVRKTPFGPHTSRLTTRRPSTNRRPAIRTGGKKERVTSSKVASKPVREKSKIKSKKTSTVKAGKKSNITSGVDNNDKVDAGQVNSDVKSQAASAGDAKPQRMTASEAESEAQVASQQTKPKDKSQMANATTNEPQQKKVAGDSNTNSERITASAAKPEPQQSDTGRVDATVGLAATAFRPSNAMQASHSSATDFDVDRPATWMELSDDAKIKTLDALQTVCSMDAGASIDLDLPTAQAASEYSPSSQSLTSSDNGSSNKTPAEMHQEVEENQSHAETEASKHDSAEKNHNHDEAESSNHESAQTLTYQIPEDDYRAAATASLSSARAYWSHTLYRGGPKNKAPQVYYCTDIETAEERAKLLLDEQVLGFDLEWEPKSSLKHSPIKRNLSLIQLAAEDKILLVHIAWFKGDTITELMPPTLRKILESPSIIKTGVHVSGDMGRLQKCLEVDMKGVMELSHLYRLVKFSVEQPQHMNFKPVSLADQVQNVLLLPLKKDDTRVSNWSKYLNKQQTDYAAADAYAGFRLFHKLEEQRLAMVPTPPRPAFFETKQPIILGNGKAIERSGKKTPVTSVDKPVAVVDDTEEGEEYEEFFDAQEDIDPYELASSKSHVSESSVDKSSTRATADGGYVEVAPEILEDDSRRGVRETSEQDEHPVQQPSSPLQMVDADSTVPDTSNDISYPTLEGLSISDSTTAESTDETNTNASTHLLSANTWLASYTNSSRARPSELRAYHLWHYSNLTPQEIASTLRSPPLQLTTVASYILQAVKEANLPYDVARIRECLELIPKSVHWKYKRVVDRARKWEKGA